MFVSLFRVFLFVIFFQNSLFSMEGINNEGFLSADTVNLQKVPGKSHLWSCGKDSFDKVFPIADSEDAHPLVGQICNSIGTGSGVLVQKSGDYVIGFTAGHVMRGANNIYFVQGQFLDEDTQTVKNLGIVDVDSFYFHKTKDIAIFRGVYRKGTFNQEIINTIFSDQEKLPDRVKCCCGDRMLSFSIAHSTHAVNPTHMYHYPVGVKEQRYNSGNTHSHIGRHKVSTLPGSSGAPIFDDKGSLCGIHTGRGNETEKVLCTGTSFDTLPEKDRTFSLCDHNQFEPITLDEYKELKRNLSVEEGGCSCLIF